MQFGKFTKWESKYCGTCLMTRATTVLYPVSQCQQFEQSQSFEYLLLIILFFFCIHNFVHTDGWIILWKIVPWIQCPSDNPKSHPTELQKVWWNRTPKLASSHTKYHPMEILSACLCLETLSVLRSVFLLFCSVLFITTRKSYPSTEYPSVMLIACWSKSCIYVPHFIQVYRATNCQGNSISLA